MFARRACLSFKVVNLGKEDFLGRAANVINNGRVQQTQLLRSGSVSARCYWMI